MYSITETSCAMNILPSFSLILSIIDQKIKVAYIFEISDQKVSHWHNSQTQSTNSPHPILKITVALNV